MGGCAGINCSNHSRKNVRMFRFPREGDRRKKWAVNCRRKDWEPGPHAQLCISHFEESQFEVNRADNWKKLKSTAVPTLFDVPNPPQTLALTRKKGIGCPKPGTILDIHQTSLINKKYTKKVVQSRIGNKNCNCILSKSIDFPDLLNILPSEYSYALCDLKKLPNSESFQCRFRINISTKEAAIEWLQQFTVTNVNCKYETCSEDTQNHIYKVQLKCDQEIRTDKSRLHTTGNLKCPAKLTLIVKRTSLVDISKDIHLEEFPTEVLLFHLHNHPRNCAKKIRKQTLNMETMKTFMKLLESGCTPSSKVLRYINELQNTDQDEYDCSMVKRKSEVLRYINELQRMDQDDILGSDHDCSVIERKIEDTDDREVSQCESNSSLSPMKTEDEIEQESELLLLGKFQTELQNLYAKVRDNPSLLPAAEKFVEQSQKIDTVDALASALSAFGRCGDVT